MKLFDSELRVLEVLWERGETPARELARILEERIGWNTNTTYTVVKKCVAKGAVARGEPGFLCRALISREEVRRSEAEELLDRLFDGSAELLVSSLLSSERLSPEELRRLRAMVEEHD